MGELEAAGSCFDALWIAGWSDDAWPQRGAPNPLLPLALQREYNLPHSSAETDLEFARSVSARLLQSAAQVTVSWPAAEEDRQLRPSPLTAMLPVADADDLGVPALQEPGRTVPFRGSGVSAGLSGSGACRGEMRSHGTRILEHQSNCPFRAFVEVRLSAAQSKRVEPGLTAGQSWTAP